MEADEVVERALEGSRPAWNAVVGAHHPAVVTYVQQRWPNLHARVGAEDVAQEAWIRIYRRIQDGLAGIRPKLQSLILPGLALRQARFVALEWLQTGRVKREDCAETVPESIDPQRSPYDRAADRQTLRRLNDSLEDLPAREKLAWQLFYEEERTPAQIAQIMGLGSEGAARTVVSRARARLVARLEGE